MPIPRSLPEFHEDDHGTIFEFEIKNSRKEVLNISDALSAEVMFMRPDGSSFSRPAQLLPAESTGDSGEDSAEDSAALPGSDGVMFYVIAPGDFTPAGNWFVQAFLELDGGSWSSSVAHFVVFPNLISLSAEVLTP